MAISYKIKGAKIAPIRSVVKIIFLIKLCSIISIPFAIIIDVGNSKKMSSEPFLPSIRYIKLTATSVFIISKIQFFLKELFTENVLGDFKNKEANVSKNNKLINQIALFFV
ncbi:hypothetical protein BTO04_10980 [Polaribacter sp. SA4-10]|nr:hypothetical protein BTO04_10980 [Polaribacter sp. SA4-10]